MQQILIINHLSSFVYLLSSVLCRLPSTSVENPLQIDLFMQNKPNFQKSKINVTSLITKDYRKNDAFVVRINKPNSYPISERPKMNANVFVTKDYENETAFLPKKTNPNKPNFKRALFVAKIGNFFPKKLCRSAEKAGEFAYLDIFFNLLNGELAFEGYYKGLFSGILPQIR